MSLALKLRIIRLQVLIWLLTPIGVNWFKVGGLWFFRVGRYQVSFCKCKASI